jgi:hypothetical protein
MPRDHLERLFPGLRNEAFALTSPIDPSYNCAAFAAGELEEWWDPYSPDGTWPDGVDREVATANFVAVFERHGFVACDDVTVEEGYEKIAIYSDASGNFGHAARQLPSGRWTSKIGELEDIEHETLGALQSPDYGQPVRFMKRRLRA